MSARRVLDSELLAKAAEMRAGGAKWEDVAAAIGKRKITLLKWIKQFADEWRAALKEAEESTISEAGAESILRLRTQLRSKDEKVAHDAARTLTTLRLNLEKLGGQEADARPVTPDDARTLTFLSGKSDDELSAVLAAVEAVPARCEAPEAEPDRGDSAA
jgi:hypothetical protein